MSDSGREISTISGMDEDELSLIMSSRFRQSERIDYHLLNDGSDEEAGPEDRIVKKLRLNLSTEGVEPLTANNSASQWISISPAPTDSQTSDTCHEETSSVEELPESSGVSGESSAHLDKNQNLSLWSNFSVSELPGKLWYPKRGKKGPIVDREIRCKMCAWKTTDSARATSTSNMKLHLGKHGIPLNGGDGHGRDEGEPKQQSLTTMFKKSFKDDVAKRLEQNLVRWMVTDDMAFLAIESSSFQQIFNDIGVSLPFRCRQTAASRIDAEFNLCRAQLVDDLALTCQSIALSLDVWTSKNSKAMLGVIGHWMTADFQYREQVLEFAEISGAHTGENMADMLHKTLVELGIERKLLTITADNASNNQTLVSDLYLLQEQLLTDDTTGRPEEFRFQGTDSYVRCLAHVLNLIVSDILSALRSGDRKSAVDACDLLQTNQNLDIDSHSALSRLRIMALWIARTPQRKEQWKVMCKANGLKSKFIEYDVDTRWNSTHRMLRDAIEAKQQIRRWVAQQQYLPPFSAQDWHRLQQVETILQKFEEFTFTVSKREPQISLAIPIYYELHDMLNDAASMEGEFSELDVDIAHAVKAGLKKYQKYYNCMDGVDAYYIALVLDPRFKALLLEKELGKSTAAKVITHLKEVLHRQYPLTTDPVAVSADEKIVTGYSIEARVLQKLQPRQRRVSDIDRYFDNEVVVVNDGVTMERGWLFEWWRMNQDEFPRMAAAARDYLAIPASEVAVERLFNTGRDLLGLRRHSLSAETMRRLMLLRAVYKRDRAGKP
jgi:hypothetical protein